MPYIQGSTSKIRRRWTLHGLHGRGLGVTAVNVGASRVYGPSLVTTRVVTPFRPQPVGPAQRFNPGSSSTTGTTPAWGSNPPIANGNSWWLSKQNGQYGGSGYQNPNNPTSQNNLAQLTLQYQSNPASLTQSQWQQLQAAGVIPSTVPYSNAGLVNPASSTAADSGIDPATGQTYASELAAAQAAAATTTASSGISTALSTEYGGIPLYGWLAGGAVLYLLMSKKR